MVNYTGLFTALTLTFHPVFRATVGTRVHYISMRKTVSNQSVQDSPNQSEKKHYSH